MTEDPNISPKPETPEQKRPNCFADLTKVFPLGKDGLRHTPDICLACPHKTECLRAAMGKKEGLKVYAETVDRAYRSGVIGFLERWSKRKDLHRKLNS
jgi:hypothetical protein